MMKKLTTLILTAAIAPAFALSSAALAGNHNEVQEDQQERAGVLNNADADKQNAGMQNDSKQTTEMQTAGMQASGEAQMSGKPANAFYADDVIGNNVMHRGTDEDVGEINDLIISEDGRILGVVVTTSGFLGLGGQDTGLGWDHIEHSMEDGESMFYTDLDEEALRNSPKYTRD